MATKLKSLKAGMLAGMAAEKSRSDSLDRFARAEAAISQHPNGLLRDRLSEQTAAFSAESAETESSRPLIRILLTHLHDNPLNARRIYDPAVVQERAASIATHGQKRRASPRRTRPGPGTTS